MSKLLTLPQEILLSLHATAKGIDPLVVHLTYPIIRAIISHLDASRDDLARSLLQTKTLWSQERAEGFLQHCKDRAKPYLSWRKETELKARKQELCQQFIDRLKTRRDLCREQIRSQLDASAMPSLKFFSVGSTTLYGGSEDLDFSSFAEEEIETHALLREKEREFLEI